MRKQSTGLSLSIFILTVGFLLLFVLEIPAQTATHKTPFDFDGDNKTDLTVWRPESGTWYILKSTDGGFVSAQFGIKTDKLVLGDYDGDGKTDIAVFRLETSVWYYVRSSDNGFVGTQFGANGDVPVPADYDGDGKTDLAVFRPAESFWHVLKSSNGELFSFQFGDYRLDLPVRGDFDGDGKNDPAVWRPSTGYWYWLKSASGYTLAATQFGQGSLGDTVGAGDYDNDGKTDLAVWRFSNGYWYVLRSSDGGVTANQFGGGVNGDVPVPGDYDGDGKSDYAVWRAPTGVWYINRSSDNTLQAAQWGSQGLGDKLAPAAFIPTGAVVGRITKASDGTAISGALVEVTEQGKFKAAVVSDSSGNFSTAGLLTGSYEVKVSALNYKDARFQNIGVVAGGTTTNNVALSPEQQNYYSDDFNDNNLSSSNFVVGLLPNGNAASEINVAENNQRLEISFQATTQPGIRYNGVRTAQARNFNNSSVVVRVAARPDNDGVSDPNGKATVSSRVEVGISDTTKYQMDIKSGSVFTQRITPTNPVNLRDFFFSPINTPYLRIRQTTLSNGDKAVSFESSPTGLDGTWKVEQQDNYGATAPFDFSNVYVSLNAGRSGSTCNPPDHPCNTNPLAAFDDLRFAAHSSYVAKAGDDKVVTIGTIPTLNGAATDQNGNAATASSYKWTLASKPSGASDPTISSPNSANTTISNLNFTGDYNFQLTVSDGNGGFSSDTIRVRVVDAPVARINAPSVIMEDEPIVFDGTLSSGAFEYEWDFGSGHKAEIPRATHVFMSPGTYNVSLKVKNEAGAVSSQTFFPVTVTQLPSATTTVNVPCGDISALQTAINNAVGRTDIVLPNGCQYTFNGTPLSLPYKSGNDYIVIRSAGAPQFTEGVRVSKDNSGDVAKMAYLNTTGVSTAARIVETAANNPGVHHYRFEGIYFRRQSNPVEIVLYDMVRLGQADENEQNIYQIPHHFVVNHCIFENVQGAATRRGILLNSIDVSVLNSAFYNIRGNAGDSYAIGAWSTPGRHAIINNYLEAGSENIIYGGAAIQLHNVSPSDITIRGNNLYKPLAWRADEFSTRLDQPTVKNHFELKHARNVIFDGNNLENNWLGASQSGPYSILLRSADDSTINPWSTTQNVQITNNRIYNSGSGIDLTGNNPDPTPEIPMYNIIVRNNLWDRIGFIRNPDNTPGCDPPGTCPTPGRLIKLTTPSKKFWFDHNTFVSDLSASGDDNPDDAIAILGESTPPLTNSSEFRFTNNLLKVNVYGFRGDSGFTPGTNGLAFLNAYAPDWLMRRNVFLLFTSDICGEFDSANRTCKNYPADNKYDLNPDDINFQNQFVNYGSGNYQLVSGSLGAQYATDGTDVGCNFPQVSTASSKAISGNWDLP